MSLIINASNLGIKFKTGKSGYKKFSRTLKDVIAQGNTVRSTQDSGDFWALRNISFTVNKGDILGVVGSNGSGKSTLLRTIAGVYSLDEGKLDVYGSISPLLSLGTGFKKNLSGYDNIFLNGVIMGFSKKEIEQHVNEIISFSELGKFIFEPVKNYSSGMRARLGFSIAVFLKRDIMLIDEVLGVGDRKFREKSQEKMLEIMNSGQTIIIVSHDLESVKKFANKCIWINKGQLMYEGNTEEVIQKYINS
ncbi:ABC transporter ATP-binding protein [Parvicella tangerina]|uniref:Teichoic acids export ATP-binding protein TagH n=1 Tax=Parvicella tangerina TaxID=2829795 RepID=A0A916N913_9FLAO|nr:ABC transporter ATP-binding protein [Parvicella tangerina]CAG5078070.1 Teichoic acids export ATP-binding protein TagH [Parvicella tangerina]